MSTFNPQNIDNRFNSNAVLAGEWREIGGWEFRLAAAGMRNRKFLSFYTKHKMRENADKVLATLLPQLLAEAIVLDWKAHDADGNTIPYSKKNALLVFDLHPELAQQVFNDASSMAAVLDAKADADEEALGNSLDGGPSGTHTSSSSNGSSPPASASKRSKPDPSSPPAPS